MITKSGFLKRNTWRSSLNLFISRTLRKEKPSLTPMEKIIKNSGLQHLAENIFLNLNYEALEECFNINSSCKEILENPLFWLKLFIRRGLSKENQKDWHRAIQLVKNTDLEKNIFSYLKRSSKNPRVVDIPCYINEDTIMEYSKMSKLNNREFGNIDYWNNIPCGCVQLSSPVISKGQGYMLMMEASSLPNLNGSTLELVNVLVSLIEDPNAIPLSPPEALFGAVSNRSESPILMAAKFGHTESVKILAPLTKNPNAPNSTGITPIFVAAMKGHIEIVKMLIPLTKNPNTANKWYAYHAYGGAYGDLPTTPLEAANINGHVEIAKLLEPFKN